MSAKFIIYIVVTIMVVWSLEAVNINQIFKKMMNCFKVRFFYLCFINLITIHFFSHQILGACGCANHTGLFGVPLSLHRPRLSPAVDSYAAPTIPSAFNTVNRKFLCTIHPLQEVLREFLLRKPFRFPKQ